MTSAKEENLPPELDSEGNARKRVCKACDRCRLKKSKCDGATPCNRCQTDNAICVFGERKRSQDKIYPKGYVEMLEQEHTKLVNATREMYNRLESNNLWPGPALQRTPKGSPLIHDILERLGLHKLGPEDSAEHIEESADILRKKMLCAQGDNSYPTPATVQLGYSPANSEIIEPQFPQRRSNEFAYYPPFQATPPTTAPLEQMSYSYDSSGIGGLSQPSNGTLPFYCPTSNYAMHMNYQPQPDYGLGLNYGTDYRINCDTPDPRLPTPNVDNYEGWLSTFGDGTIQSTLD